MGRLSTLVSFLAFYCLTLSNAWPAPSSPLGLGDVLAMAEQYSPDLKASFQGERQASEKIRIGESAYYPTLDFTAVDSTGFPASASTPAGFDGLMDSPFRSGWSVGAFTRVTLFDLTREYGVAAAESGLRAARGSAQVTLLDVDLVAMNLYMDAVLSQRQREVWKKIQGEVDRIYAVVRKFVKNGQYSEVTQWLLKDQSERALQEQEVFEQAYEAAVRRIEILTGRPAGSVLPEGIDSDVDSLESVLRSLARSIPSESPLILRPRLEAETSHRFASQQAAQNWPRLVGVASAGAMNDSRLVPVQNYSAWIGVTLPIFEGFRISAETEQARAEASRRDDLVEVARLRLADSEIHYSQEVKSREVDVHRYGVERDFAREAMKLAEHRLVTFVGDLADVRDSLSSYEAAESGLSAARAELFRARLELLLIRGARTQKTGESGPPQ